MKRCPNCQRTYEDNMKFCQADGTPLVDDAPPAADANDPFKTVIANPLPSEQEQESDFDPMKTMLATPPPLDAPPPSPFDDKPKGSGINAPSFGDLGSPQFNESPLPSESAPRDRQSGGFGQQSPGQFGEQKPSGGFGSSEPTYKEPSSPFGNQPNFGNDPFNNQPKDWTAPPAPQGWGNQGLGQNTPFSAPPVRAQGQNQVLGIVSLVSGIIAMLCCYVGFLLGPAALITGYMTLNNVKKDPAQYGGKGLAIAGMITGGLGTLISVAYLIYVIFIIGLAASGNLN